MAVLQCILISVLAWQISDALFIRNLRDLHVRDATMLEVERALPKWPPAKRAAVSAADAKAIIAKHNELRSKVNPSASNMMQMYYSDKLAAGAQAYAESCPDGHNTNDQRKAASGIGINVGQNMAWGYKTWDEAIMGWYGEVKDFKYGVGSFNGGVVGHFTQVVRDHATHVGCGFKDCPGKSMPTHFICDYAYAQMNSDKPYKSGSSCGDCPNSCKNNLCDCGDKICQNGGEMDPGSCTCKCKAPFAGDTCASADCPNPDPDYCGQPQPYGYDASLCAQYSNVPEECPKMCGVC